MHWPSARMQSRSPRRLLASGRADAASAWRRSGRDFWSRLFHASACQASSLESESVALVLLSLADLMVTYHLLKMGPRFLIEPRRPVLLRPLEHRRDGDLQVQRCRVRGRRRRNR